MSTAEGESTQLALEENETRVALGRGPLTGPVLARVVSMVLTRADWPVDRLHEAMLVCDALGAHAPGHVLDGHVTFSLLPQGERVRLCVESLAPEGAAAIVREAMLPGVGNVLEKIPESLSVEPHKGGSRLVLVLKRG
jgi:serine/threonine-protein kinase RsbW